MPRKKILARIALLIVALMICTAFVGTSFALYKVTATPAVVSISAVAGWNGVLTVDVTAISWFETDDCRANIFITYSDSSTNAAYPGEAMTRTSAGVYTVQTNTAKTISTIQVIRMNGLGIYMYNQTNAIAAGAIPANHTITLSAGDLNEIAASNRTPYYALSVNITWQYFPGADALLYVWYSDAATTTTVMEKTEAGSYTYTANWDSITSGKTVSGFMILRCQTGNPSTIYNKSREFGLTDITNAGASRLLTVADMYNW